MKTPGFTDKKFDFSGTESAIIVLDDEPSEPKINHGYKRSMTGMSDISNQNSYSENSSEMGMETDSDYMETEAVKTILRRHSILRNKTTSETQTDLYYNDKSRSETADASIQTELDLEAMVKEYQRKLELERSENLLRLKEIEKQLTKTEQTSKLWEDNESTKRTDDEESDQDESVVEKKESIATRNKLFASKKMPMKNKRSAIEQERMSEEQER